MPDLSDTFLREAECDPAGWRMARTDGSLAAHIADAGADLRAAIGIFNAVLLSTLVWLAIADLVLR
jgi:hypothetical protein